MKKFTHRYIPVEYTGIHWNPLESSWNRWGTLKYCVVVREAEKRGCI